MTAYDTILQELQRFLNRFYTRSLLQGLFLFIFFGGLLFLAVGGLEYTLWMPGYLRSLMFWSLLGLLGWLFVRHILVPVMQLLRFRKGISLKEGSRLIGIHFPEVDDRLYNLLELAENPEKSELILASIEQRSERLKTVPFYKAVEMKQALRYGRYALIPIGLALMVWISGKGIDFLNSYQRVARYNVAFEPPAPFHFELLDADLEVLENKPFILKVKTTGSFQPDEVRVVLNGTPLLMEDQLTHFEYVFRPPLQNAVFHLEAAGVKSQDFELQVLRVPVVDRFEMELAYPKYLNRPGQVLKGSGNATVPEGTLIRWRLSTINTDTVRYNDADTTMLAAFVQDRFTVQKKWFRPREYSFSTSNQKVQAYDRLTYKIQVIRDEFPQLQVRMERDSLNPNLVYFGGTASDDYGLASLEILCQEEGIPDKAQRIPLGRPTANLESFYYTFPSGLQWEGGRSYLLTFLARDNDGVHGGKETRSQEFRISLLNEEQLEQERLGYQKNVLENLGRNNREREEAKAAWDSFMEKQKELKEMGFNDRQELKNMVDRQQNQEKLMERFSRELSESLDKEAQKGPENELLKERLERQELEARKNAALMEELRKVLDKIDQQELQERLEELGKSRESNQRSIEQLLELTKRYYVTQKARELAGRLNKLSERQDILSQLDDLKESFTEKEQETLNSSFEELVKELEQLEKDNQALKKPLPWKRDTPREVGTQSDQKDALDLLRKQGGESQSNPGKQSENAQAADKKQKAAARKMQELSQAMQQEASASGQSDDAEDAEMLRQILDNLVIFSLQEEDLFNQVRGQEEGSLRRSGDILRQQELRKMFEHADDSLFALSLRRPELSDHVNKQITEVYYNIDKSLESLGENQWYRGASYQQYVITASNELAAMLAEILENMQASLRQGGGQGGGSDMQLPDIIQSQEELQGRMQGSQQGQDGKGKDSNPGQEDGTSGEGQQGESGNGSGNQGQEQGNGKEGNQGGQQGEPGEEGQGSGSSGNGDELGYEELFEIYKEQQRIRGMLERQLEDMINDTDRELAKRIAQEMERFENELLENGVTRRTEQRLNRIREQMLRLKNAALQQGETEEREGTTNLEEFSNPILTRPESFENQHKDVEILSRQALPLRRLYKNKVKSYFEKND